jgi:putative endonuclease
MPFFCYIVECANGAFYTGWTTNLARRIKQHNTGKGAKYTRMNHPVKLVYVEELENRSSAQKREAEIKKLSHTQKAALIESHEPPPVL